MRFFAFLLFAFVIFPAYGAEVVTVFPNEVYQGDPFMTTFASGVQVKKVIFDGKAIPVFSYEGKLRALVGIDLQKPAGEYPLRMEFTDGGVSEKMISILPREKIEAPLGIPEKLGGNTEESQKNLVLSLAKENAVLMGLRTGTKAFWTEPFRFPVTDPVVTDVYGYNRKTGEYTIPHKGTDFRAEKGTEVMVMNRGVVRLARNFRVYGKTIVIDHGLGLQTMYMHLSRIKVRVGELVIPGQMIGLSGDTGYAEAAHLHLTVRVGGISIDPEKFLAFFGKSAERVQ